MDARRAPQWILLAHPSDEFAQLRFDFGPARLTAGFPAPIGPKPRSMPPQDCIRLNDTGQIEQAWPDRVIHTIRARSLPCSRRRSRRRYGARLKQGTPAADADPLDETLAPCPKVWLYGGRQARREEPLRGRGSTPGGATIIGPEENQPVGLLSSNTMPFRRGQSGNPHGRPLGASTAHAKMWFERLRIAIHRTAKIGEDGKPMLASQGRRRSRSAYRCRRQGDGAGVRR